MPSHRKCRLEDNCSDHVKGLKSPITAGGPEDFGYLREYISDNIRLIYVFQREMCEKDTQKSIFQQFISEESAPDLMVMSAGPWDSYSGYSLEETIPCLASFWKKIKVVYAGPVVWMNLVTCHKNFEEWANGFNAHAKPILTLHGDAVWLNRAHSTENFGRFL